MARNPTAVTIIKSLKAVGTPPHYFGWIPPHGRNLNPGQIISVQGLVETWLNRVTNKTKLTQYLSDIAAGIVEVSHEVGATIGTHTPVQDNFELAAIAGDEAEAYEDQMYCL